MKKFFCYLLIMIINMFFFASISSSIALTNTKSNKETQIIGFQEIHKVQCYGDINNDEYIDLSDLIITLNICSGNSSFFSAINSDVNRDSKIGNEEVVYIMQVLSKIINPVCISETFKPKTCSDIGLSNCIEVWPGKSSSEYEFHPEHNVYFFRNLSNVDHYFLLMGNIKSTSTGAVFGFDAANPSVDAKTVFDLNGYTITYSSANYETIPNNGFEKWNDINTPQDWTVISGVVEQRSTKYWMPMSGEYLLYTENPLIIKSSPIYLPLKRAYNAYVTIGRAKDTDITLEVLNSNDQVICSITKPGFFRGQTIACRFDLDNPGYYYIRLSTQGYAYFDLNGIVPIDDHGIGVFTAWSLNPNNSRHKAVVENFQGLDIPASGDHAYPDRLNVFEIKNGNIIAGHENQASYGVYISGTTKLIMHDVKIFANGIKSHSVKAGGEIYNNYLEVNMPWYFARESTEEENVILEYGMFFGNSAINGQGVIRLDGEGTKIFNNYLRNNAQATNHYAIIHSGATNPVIHDNIFDPVEGSGILTYVGHGYRIFNNTFNVKTAPCNVEYINEDYSTNGIRMNDYNSGDNYDNWVYDNIFNIVGENFETAWEKCMPVTTGIFYTASGVDNKIYNNKFNITKTNSDEKAPVYGLYIGGEVYNKPVNNKLIYDNYFETNDKAIWISTFYGSASDLWLENNTFNRIENKYYTPVMPEAAIQMGHTGKIAKNLRLINNHYLNGFDSNKIYFTGSVNTGIFDLVKKWYWNVSVKDGQGNPLSGVNVQASSLNMEENIKGFTDNNGDISLIITEYTEFGDMIPDGSRKRQIFTPYSLYVEHNGFIKYIDSIDIEDETTTIITLGEPCLNVGEIRNCGNNSGRCTIGQSVCQENGFWGKCEGAVTPIEEICNGIDDDCDGRTDEGLGTISCGLGLCEHSIDSCIGGISQNCNPFDGQGYEDEITNCENNIDEDCDGEDSKCQTIFELSNENITFNCNVSDSKGIQSISLLTDESGLMKEVLTKSFVENKYFFIEAEHFLYDPLDWNVCPNNAANIEGNKCEDDRSNESIKASNFAHAMTNQNITTGDVTDMTYSLEIPAGTYTIWARSFCRSSSSIRTWRVSIDDFQSNAFGNTGEINTWIWEKSDNQLIISEGGEKTVRIIDASPDAYWSYQDLIIITTDSNFDPEINCNNDITIRYSLESCNMANKTQNFSFSYEPNNEFLQWACATVNGVGETLISESKLYSEVYSH